MSIGDPPEQMWKEEALELRGQVNELRRQLADKQPTYSDRVKALEKDNAALHKRVEELETIARAYYHVMDSLRRARRPHGKCPDACTACVGEAGLTRALEEYRGAPVHLAADEEGGE